MNNSPQNHKALALQKIDAILKDTIAAVNALKDKQRAIVSTFIKKLEERKAHQIKKSLLDKL